MYYIMNKCDSPRMLHAHLTTSWLDHVISSHNMNLLVQNLHVLNKLPCSDHLPVVVTFDIVIDMSNPTDKSAGDVVTSFNWSKATDHDILSYTCLTDVELRSLKGYQWTSVSRHAL